MPFKTVSTKYITRYCSLTFDILETDKLRGGHLVDHHGFPYRIVADDFDSEAPLRAARSYTVTYGSHEVVVVVLQRHAGRVKLLLFPKSGSFL